MKDLLPRIEISLPKIRHNARLLCQLYGSKGLSVMGVSKAILGDPSIALAMIQGGVNFIADSRIENILKMKQAGIVTTFVLLRTALSQAESVVNIADISLNTELATIQELSYYAQEKQKNTPHYYHDGVRGFTRRCTAERSRQVHQKDPRFSLYQNYWTGL
jgi:predicted amino acid racemase